jgi:hypothetical protein
LTFRDREEFAQCLCFVAEHPEVSTALARRGRQYVLDNYQWDGVLDVIEETLEQWLPC